MESLPRPTPHELIRAITDFYFDWAGFGSEPLLVPILAEERFWLWPASANGKHHCYPGGLAQHTLEVMQICRSVAESPVWAGRVNARVLATGALWHDIGKIDSYLQPDPVVTPREGFIQPWHRSATEKRGVPHIVSGLMRWGWEARQPLNQADHENVAHLIASHHGRMEWGSPVIPKSVSALILHQADMLSVMSDSGHNPQNRE